ncbi:MAG: DUF1178 family protein [Hyphomicrobiales bacterium]
MIRYALICENAHRFDGWFGGAEAFDAQVAAGEIACPQCGSTGVAKALMAPAVSGARHEDGETGTAGAAAAPAIEGPGGERAEMLGMLRELKDKLLAGADYVGERFAEEARRIHYEEAPARGIYGEATAEEARGLLDEGIEFQPLPILPDERN